VLEVILIYRTNKTITTRLRYFLKTTTRITTRQARQCEPQIMLLFSSMQMRRTSICWHLQLRTRCFVGAVLEKMLDNWFYISVLWRCWLGGRKGIRPAKNWVVGCWRGYLSGTRCRLAYGSADATVTHFSEIQIGFTFLVLAHPGNPVKRAVKHVCVCVCVGFGAVSLPAWLRIH